MENVLFRMSDGPNFTSVAVEIANRSAESVTVFAPDLYLDSEISNEGGQPCSELRFTCWNRSSKTTDLAAGKTIRAILDLESYYSSIAGIVIVRVIFQVADKSGARESVPVEGKVHLDIQGLAERMAILKTGPRVHGGPYKIKDISDDVDFVDVPAKSGQDGETVQEHSHLVSK